MDDIRGALDRLERGMAELAARVRPSLPLVLTVKAAAAQLSVSERTMRTLVADGKVPSVLVGGRRMVPSASLLRMAQPVEQEASTKRAGRRPRAAARLDMDAELAQLQAVSRRRRGG